MLRGQFSAWTTYSESGNPPNSLWKQRSRLSIFLRPVTGLATSRLWLEQEAFTLRADELRGVRGLRCQNSTEAE